MFKLLIDDHIPFVERYFPKYFHITRFDAHQDLKPFVEQQDILIVRSVTPVTASLLKPSHFKIIATASAGHEHIDRQALSQHNIQFFSAHGANAHAVTDYITSTLAYLFIHQKIHPKAKIAIIGYGHVGNLVYQRLQKLGFDLGVYDPFQPNHPQPIELQDLIDYDVLCLHPNYHQKPPYPSHLMINHHLISNLKPNVCIINAARGKIVDEDAILHSAFKGHYCTDVYWREPEINPEIVDKAVLCTPHIAGHTLEAKARITAMLSEKIHQYLGLPPPSEQSLDKKNIELPFIGWEAQALQLYDPQPETLALKHNSSKQHFLELRRAHTFRHDFPWYP